MQNVVQVQISQSWNRECGANGESATSDSGKVKMQKILKLCTKIDRTQYIVQHLFRIKKWKWKLKSKSNLLGLL